MSLPAQAKLTRLQTVGIGLFLAFQVATPLRYYLGPREQRYDERFSWRMFSTLRLRDCKVQVVEQVRTRGQLAPREVNVERDVHVAWLRLLERMRSTVIEAYLARRCQLSSDAERVDFTCHCNDTDGKELPALEQSLECRATDP